MNYPADYIGKVIEGDCLEVMKGMPDKCVDLVLTDPPYGVKRDKGFGGATGFGGKGKPIERREYEDDWDGERPNKTYFDEIIRIGRKVMIFGGNYFADILPQSTHWIFWDKLQTMPTFGDGELIWTNFDRKSVKKITKQYNGLLGVEENREHPTQKPLNLMAYLVRENTEGADTILDPFLGSGTTAVAAEGLNRKWIGIEKEPKYCEIARRRLSQVQSEIFT